MSGNLNNADSARANAINDEMRQMYNADGNTNAREWFFNEDAYIEKNFKSTAIIAAIDEHISNAQMVRNSIVGNMESPEGKDLEGNIQGIFDDVIDAAQGVTSGLAYIMLWSLDRFNSGVKAEKISTKVVNSVGYNLGLDSDFAFIYANLKLNENPKALVEYILETTKKAKNVEELYSFFNNTLSWGNGEHGVDQGIFRDLLQIDPNRYDQLINTITNKYNLSYEDAVRTTEILDSIGACSHAALSNTILASYRGRASDFESDFGFPMYTTNSNGSLIVNSEELLVDIFIFLNSTSNGGKIFDDSSKKTYIDKNYLESYEFVGINGKTHTIYNNIITEQEYTSYSSGWDVKKIQNYLNSKSSNFEFKATGTVKGYVGNNPYAIHFPTNENDIRSGVQQALLNGENVLLFIAPDTDGEIMLQSLDSTYNDASFAGAHDIFVTRADSDGVVVSSWGREYFISYEDLVDSGEYRFDFCTITKKEGGGEGHEF